MACGPGPYTCCPKAVARQPQRRRGRDQGASSQWEQGRRLVVPKPPVPQMGQGCRRPTALPFLTVRCHAGRHGRRKAGKLRQRAQRSSPQAPVTPMEPSFSANRQSFGFRLAGGGRTRPWGSRACRGGSCWLYGAEAGRGLRGRYKLKRGSWRKEGTEQGQRRPLQAPWRSAGSCPLWSAETPVRPHSLSLGPRGIRPATAGRPFDLVCRREG